MAARSRRTLSAVSGRGPARSAVEQVLVRGRRLAQVLEQDHAGQRVDLGEPAPAGASRTTRRSRVSAASAWPFSRSQVASATASSADRAPRPPPPAGRSRLARPRRGGRREGARTASGALGALSGPAMSAGRAGRARRSTNQAASAPSDEAADVRAVRDAALAREEERQQVVEEQVDPEHEPRRHLEDVHEERGAGRRAAAPWLRGNQTK